MAKNASEPPIGHQRKEPASKVADAFAALAVKVVLKESADLPVLSVLADKNVRPDPH